MFSVFSMRLLQIIAPRYVMKMVINNRTAIAGDTIGLLLVFFYNSKSLNCIGALSFF